MYVDLGTVLKRTRRTPQMRTEAHAKLERTRDQMAVLMWPLFTHLWTIILTQNGLWHELIFEKQLGLWTVDAVQGRPHLGCIVHEDARGTAPGAVEPYHKLSEANIDELSIDETKRGRYCECHVFVVVSKARAAARILETKQTSGWARNGYMYAPEWCYSGRFLAEAMGPITKDHLYWRSYWYGQRNGRW
jgi:hypothetical protein